MENNLINDSSDSGKPKKIFWGCIVLYTACILELGYSWLEQNSISNALLTAILLGIIVFLTSEGKKWARSLILFITIIKTIALPFAIWNFIKSDYQTTIKSLLFSTLILKCLVALYGTIMLYSKSANIWFNREKGALRQ